MRIIILGNGISGITAARFIRKLSDYEIIVVSKETDHFFSRTALMYIYMGHMRYQDTKPYSDDFWKKNRIQLVRGEVSGIDFSRKELVFSKQRFKDSSLGQVPERVSYDKLVLATGSIPNRFGWPGQDLQGVGQLYSFQDLEYLERVSTDIQSAVIVGGGLIGIELAEMIHSRQRDVTFLVREESYWSQVLPPEESAMINDHIREHGIDLRLSTELSEIIPDDRGYVKSIKTSEGDEIPCQYVGLTAGVRPNVGFLKESELDIDIGVLVDQYLQTNIPDVYAVGDCVQLKYPKSGRRAIEAVWYTGRMMGETVAYTICEERRAYDPGIWFNSAKFFDIEYQVYGDVPSVLPIGIDTIFWMSDDRKKSIRLNYEKATKRITGFNLMGVRFRHEVCEKWIVDKTSIEEVVSNLSLAFFDPEFYNNYYESVWSVASERMGLTLNEKQNTSTLDRVLSFLNK